MPHTFHPQHAKHLDSTLRKIFFPPSRILRTIGLKSNDIFLDIGAGTGYFSIPASQIITYGKVIAIDTQDEMLQLLSHKIKKQNINNIEIIHSSQNNPSVPEDLGTVAFMSFVLHEVENKKEMLVNVHRALKKGGKIVIIEFSKHAIFGPPKQERISAEYVKKLLEETGFTGITVKKLTMFTYMAKAFKH
ncbi:MAG: class I SAM-dependent methyltransferase [Spirochaetota bacterium]